MEKPCTLHIESQLLAERIRKDDLQPLIDAYKNGDLELAGQIIGNEMERAQLEVARGMGRMSAVNAVIYDAYNRGGAQ